MFDGFRNTHSMLRDGAVGTQRIGTLLGAVSRFSRAASLRTAHRDHVPRNRILQYETLAGSAGTNLRSAECGLIDRRAGGLRLRKPRHGRGSYGRMPAVLPSRDEIIAIISEEARIDVAKLTPDASLASLDIASLDVVSVLFAIEDKYGVDIPAEDVASAATLGEFVDIIAAKVVAA
jgi:acyl carrier protein